MNNQYSTHLDSYKESKALQQLLEAASAALENQNRAFDSDNDYIDEFTITINGVQTAFMLGGPQFDALLDFVSHISNENFYAVDFDKNTVEE